MRLSKFEALLLLVSLLLSAVFLNMFPVYARKDLTMGMALLLEAVVGVFLFLLMRWGYGTLAEVMAAVSLGALVLLRPPTVYLGAVPVPWWAICIPYALILIACVLFPRPKEENAFRFIALFFVSVFIIIGATAVYEGLVLSPPPDVLRGLSAATKIKTWRSMGALLGVMNVGAAVAMTKGKYLHYLLLISFTLPALFTVTLSFGRITFGVFSQVLLLTQLGVSGLVTSWYAGSKR